MLSLFNFYLRLKVKIYILSQFGETVDFMNFPTFSAFFNFVMSNVKVIFPDINTEKLSKVVEHRHLLIKNQLISKFFMNAVRLF